MSLGVQARRNADERASPETKKVAAAKNLAKKINSMRSFGIENVWMRFNETENSEFNASRVLDYSEDVFHDMMITLGVRDQKGFHIDKLNEALVAHDIHAAPRSYQQRKS